MLFNINKKITELGHCYLSPLKGIHTETSHTYTNTCSNRYNLWIFYINNYQLLLIFFKKYFFNLISLASDRSLFCDIFITRRNMTMLCLFFYFFWQTFTDKCLMVKIVWPTPRIKKVWLWRRFILYNPCNLVTWILFFIIHVRFILYNPCNLAILLQLKNLGLKIKKREKIVKSYQ